MRVKNIIFEDFVQYKKCSMFIGTCFCDWKCCKEANCNICQNMPLAKSPIITIDDDELAHKYVTNPLTSAIVYGGLEPLDQFDELLASIDAFRKVTDDDIVIYTGFYPTEISEKIFELQKRSNIIVKFGRFKPNANHVHDKILGVELSSDNQWAEKIS